MIKQRYTALFSPRFIKALTILLIVFAVCNVLFGISFLTLAYPSGEGFRFSQVTSYAIASAMTLPLLFCAAWLGAEKGSGKQRYGNALLLTLAFYSLSGFVTLIFDKLTGSFVFADPFHHFTPLFSVVAITVVTLVASLVLRSWFGSSNRYPIALQWLFVAAMLGVVAIIATTFTAYLPYFNRPESALIALYANAASILLVAFFVISYILLRKHHTNKTYSWFAPSVVTLTAFLTYLCIETATSIPLRSIRIQSVDVSVAEIISPIIAILVFITLLIIYKRDVIND